MSKFSEMIGGMSDEIHKYINKCIESASFDKTKQGIITENLGDSKYSVKIDGTVYTVPSLTSEVCNVNDIVFVLYIQNDAKRKYIIGKAVK